MVIAQFTLKLFCTKVLVALLCVSTLVHGNELKKPENTSQSIELCEQLAWIDNAYCLLNYGIDSSAHTVNSWFKHDNSSSDQSVKTKGRIRFGWEPRSGDLSELDFRFNIRATLPAFKERVELLLSDEEDDVNEQAVKAARRDEFGNTDQTVLALQFKQEPSDKLSYRVGFGRGSQLYTRARYTDDINFNENTKMRYFTEINYYSKDRSGFEANAEITHVLDAKSAIEFKNSIRYRSLTHDWLWRHELQYVYLGKDQTSYLYAATIDGLSEPSYQKEQILLSFRYKRPVLRKWLFAEVEPFVLWLRKENFRASFGLSLRLEVHFST